MTSPATGTCSPWAIASDIKGPCQDFDCLGDQAAVDEAIQAASDTLYLMSGRQFPGACTITVRPCPRPAPESTPARGLAAQPHGETGMTVGTYVGTGAYQSTGGSVCSSCGLGSAEVWLTPGPVTAVSEVKIDGNVLDPSLYRVDGWKYLVRLPDPDGNNPGWPHSQSLDLASTEPDTFEVTFSYGRAPPPAGVRAAAELACEFLLSSDPELSGKCRLPQRVQSITRQGVSLVVLDPMDLFEKGRTGLPAVDLFIKSVNPKGLQRSSQVISPDISPRVRRVGT